MVSTCKLCGHQAPLMKSHIIPEFLWASLYDEKHRTIVSDEELSSKRMIQRGIREPLLCSRCEGNLGEVERRVSRVWTLPAKPALEVYPLEIGSYADVKLLLLAVLWRASIATIGEFAAVTLGSLEIAVRDRLTRADPGPSSEFPIVGRLLVSPQDGTTCTWLVPSPVPACFDGFDGHLFFFPGVAWFAAPRSTALALRPGALPRLGRGTFRLSNSPRSMSYISYSTSAGNSRLTARCSGPQLV